MDKFISFLDKLVTSENYSLVESICIGYITVLESINLPVFRIRSITEPEALNLAKKKNNPQMFPYLIKNFKAVDVENHPEIEPFFAPNEEVAKRLKREIERQSSGIVPKGKTKPVIPVTMPPGTIYEPEETENLAPEIKNIDVPENKQETLKYFYNWNDWANKLKNMSEHLKEIKKKYPHILED